MAGPKEVHELHAVRLQHIHPIARLSADCASLPAASQVRCCSDKKLSGTGPGSNSGPGWFKHTGCLVWGGSNEGFDCEYKQNFTQAEDFCDGVGAKLCTVAELEDGCAAGTGCNHDYRLVWGIPTPN